MTAHTHRGGWIIFFTFVAAMILLMVPLPEWARLLRPEWVVMVLIYWCMALPERVGVGLGWFAGLMVDVAQGTLLGQHALAMALVAFLTIKLHQRIRVFPLGQQALTVLLLVMIYSIVMLWIRGLTGTAPTIWSNLAPTLTTALAWPWLFMFMRFVRRRYQVK